MRFRAEYISFEEIDGVFNFALGDKPEKQPETYVIIQFGEETEQDRSLGLTGLHIETSDGVLEGYGKVGHIAYDGEVVSITGRFGAGRIDAEIVTDMMAPDEISEAVEQCNRANATQPDLLNE
jgi:hypothetical protein